MKTKFYTFFILAIPLIILLVSVGCIHVKDGDDEVSISPAGIHVKDGDGDNVDISAGGVHVKDANGESVDISAEGVYVKGEDGETVEIDVGEVVINDNDGSMVEVKENVVHISDEESMDIPENWPDDVPVYKGFKITDYYVRGKSDECDAHKELIGITDENIDTAEIQDFYSLQDKWHPDQFESMLLPDPAEGESQAVHTNGKYNLIVVITPLDGGGLQLSLKVFELEE